MNPQKSPTPFASAGETDGGGSGGTEASGALAETKTKIAQTARDAAAKVKSAAASTTAKVKGEAERIVSEKKETAANRIGGYSAAIHDSAQSLEEKDPNIAWFTHRAADKLQGVAEYVRHRDFSGLRNDLEDIARRHPAAFFGGMFLTGLLLGNLVKASGSAVTRSRHELEDNADATNAGGNGDNSQRQGELSISEREAAGI